MIHSSGINSNLPHVLPHLLDFDNKRYNQINNCYFNDNLLKKQQNLNFSDKIFQSNLHSQQLKTAPFSIELVSTANVLSPQKRSFTSSKNSISSAAQSITEERRSLLDGSVEFTI